MSSSQLNLHLTKKRWLVLWASCAANLALGAFFAWSVFAPPMAEHLNALHGSSLSAADLAVVFSLSNGLGVISMVAGGAVEKKIGARMVILIGSILFGLGFIISGLADSFLMLMLGFSIVGGLANGFAYVCTVSNSVKLFPDKKGLVGGISTASYGISAVIIPPIADLVNRSLGVSASFIIFGLAIIIISALSCLLIENCPDDFIPVGWSAGKEGERLCTAEDKTPLQMMGTVDFYLMVGIFFVGCMIGLMMISETSSIAQTMIGMSSAAAALAVSVLSLFNTGGRIFAGWLSDRLGRINTLILEFVLAALGLGLMYISGGSRSAALFCVGVCLVGMSYGAFIAVYPGFTSDRFGLRYNSINFALMFIGNALSGFAAQIMMQFCFNTLGSYRPAFPIAIFFVFLGLSLCFIFRRLERKKHPV